MWFVAYLFATGSSIANSYNTLPEMDAWEKVAHLDSYLRFPPAVLWQQHYEHRVIFPEMVLAFDWLVLKGREVLPMALTSALDFGVWIVLLLAVRRSAFPRLPPEGSAIEWCALFLAGIVMAWPGVAFVLALPFLLQMVGYQFCAAASLYGLARGRVAWAIVLAVIATYSSANGVFIWPVLLIGGWQLKFEKPRLFAIASVGAVSSGLFFAGYRNLGNSHPSWIFNQTVKFFGYFLTYLGMPFGAFGQVQGLSPGTAGTAIGLAAGAASLVLLAVLAAITWKRRQGTQPIAIVGFGLCLLSLITALITSASRIPMDRTFTQAIVTPGRYVNTSAHYWAVLTILLIWIAAQARPKAAWIAIGCVSALFAAILLHTDRWVQDWMSQYSNYQYATLAIESGLKTNEMAEVLNYADASLVQRSLPELERRHLALYSWDRYRTVGQPLDSLALSRGAELPLTAVTAVQPVQGGVRIIGWSVPHVRHLAVVDASGIVIGLGRHLPMGLPNGVPVPVGHAADAWLAFANGSFQTGQARYFVVP